MLGITYWLPATGVFLLWATVAGSDPGAKTSAALRAKGLEAGFNLDHDAAAESFRAAVAADPQHPAAHRLLAATFWVKLLWLRGAVTVDDYSGQISGDVKRVPPPADVAAAFREHINRAIALGEQRVRQHPRDADAHFHVARSPLRRSLRSAGSLARLARAAAHAVAICEIGCTLTARAPRPHPAYRCGGHPG